MNEWFEVQAKRPDEHYRQLAQQKTDSLTKPKGSLGVLETAAVTLASMQATESPVLDKLAICIFAADHGVAEEGVSAFPQAVTAQMIRNFSQGGAAICVLARQLKAQFEVINVGTVAQLEALPNVRDRRIDAGTANFVRKTAMTSQQAKEALHVGKSTVDALDRIDCFIAGDMGIGNTTSAAALACALLDLKPASLAGKGTGLTEQGVTHKAATIASALSQHRHLLVDPLSILQCLGGFEIAALAGAYIRSAQCRIPVLVDGFICTVAALLAVRLNASVRPWLLFSHQSEEAGHGLLLTELNAMPLLTLGMRLGEGSGAAVAVPVLRMACALHNQMASFDSAGVSENIISDNSLD